MKKKILTVLALVLVLVSAVVVCTSCGKKEEAKEETAKMNITIVNQTGEEITGLTLKENIGSKKQIWNVGGLAADGEAALDIETVVEKEAPNLDFSFETKSNQQYRTSIIEKGDKSIVLKADPEGGFTAEITTK